MENDLVRYSRAGDVFHYRWAARRCLRMIYPNSLLKSITVEGSPEVEKAGEYVIDLTETYEPCEGKPAIKYYQLKHTTIRKNDPFILSDFKTTLEGFAARYTQHKGEGEILNENITYSIVTNRRIDINVKKSFAAIIAGNNANKGFVTTLEKYTTFKGDRLKEFCCALELEDGEGDYNDQKYELLLELSQVIAGTFDNVILDGIVALVQEKVMPDSNGIILKGDILRRFNVTSERDLFPAEAIWEKVEKTIPRVQHSKLVEEIFNATAPLIIHAEGGVGKSVFTRQVLKSLPNTCIGIAYDCFGAGSYRNSSTTRHMHRTSLMQIANEISAKGVCAPLIVQNTTHNGEVIRAFLRRLNDATAALKKTDPEAKLVLLIDAADNAEMAAKEFNEVCFAHELIREHFPDGCKVVFLCRTERIALLNPPSNVKPFELEGFDKGESYENLKNYFPTANEQDGLEFHRLTNGNPRVQANALDFNAPTVGELLINLGPGGTTVEDQIEAQLTRAVTRIEEMVPDDFKGDINAICLGLATLSPHIPLLILARAANVDLTTIKSFVSDIGRPLWISDLTVQFRDEPTETWFRKKFCAVTADFQQYIQLLEPLATEYVYVSQMLPQLYLQAEQYDKLIESALSDNFLPKDNPIDTRNVRVYRLQFALKAALKLRKLKDAAKLAIRAGEEMAGERRQLSLLQQNTDLLVMLQGTDKVTELAFKRAIRGSWEGSENVYSAALLSSLDDYKGDGRGFLRAALYWLQVYFDRPKKKDKFRRHDGPVLEDEDVLELAIAHLNLNGVAGCAEFLKRLKPSEVLYKVIKVLAARLVDKGNIKVLLEILEAVSNQPFYVIAITGELAKVGQIPAKIQLEKCLNTLSHAKNHIKIVEYRQSDTIRPSIMSFLEACFHRALPGNKIIKALDFYFPERAGQMTYKSYSSTDRELYLKSLSLRMIINGETKVNFDEITPSNLLKTEKDYELQNELADFKSLIQTLLPWYRARIACKVDNEVDLTAYLQESDQESASRITGRSRNADSISDEIATLCISIFRWSKKLDSQQLRTYYQFYIEPKKSLKVYHYIELVRMSYRLPHLAEFAKSLEHETYEFLQTIKDDGPEEISARYIALSRAVLSNSIDDAAAYFEHAIEVASKFGDEIYQRWEAIVALATALTKHNVADRELAHRFIRIAELVGENIREKHWDRGYALRLCTRISMSEGIAALSRWHERRIGRFEWLETSLLLELLTTKKVPIETIISLTSLLDIDQLSDFTVRCLEKPLAKAEKIMFLEGVLSQLQHEGTRFDYWMSIKDSCVRNDVSSPLINGFLKQFTAKKDDKKEDILTELKFEKPGFSWDKIFLTDDITKVQGLKDCYKRFEIKFSERKPFVPKSEFWKQVMNKVPESELYNFFQTLLDIEILSAYDTREIFREVPDVWRKKPSFKKKFDGFLEQLGMKFAQELVIPYQLNSTAEGLQLNEAQVRRVHDGMFAGLASGNEFANSEMLFGFVTVACNYLNKEELAELIEFGLSRFEMHINDDFGDGPFTPDNEVGSDDVNRSLAAFLFSSLASPKSSTRWKTAHCVRKLIKYGCSEIIDEIFYWLRRNEPGRFGIKQYPFYYLHARLYLFIALSRAALQDARLLVKHSAVILDFALRARHVVIQKFASDTALQLSKISDDIYSADELELIKNTTKSKFGITKVDHDYQIDSYLHQTTTVERETEFYFGWDFDQYWYKPLGNVFGVPGTQVEDLAAIVIKDLFGVVESGYYKDPRADLYENSSDRSSTHHDHGSYPRTDNYDFYIAYHAMMIVAADLLENMPTVIRRDYQEDNWEDWLSGHLLTRKDGKWLADFRDPVPLDRPRWLDKPHISDAILNIDESEFLETIVVREGGETWLNVNGFWHESNGSVKARYYLTSAFVASAMSESLLNALSTCTDFHDFKLPNYRERDMEINSNPFVLRGWIKERDVSKRLDEFDPLAGEIQYPPYSIGKKIKNEIGLTVSENGKQWFINGLTAPILINQLYASENRSRDEEPEQMGNLIKAKLSFLQDLCVKLQSDLIFEVQITRNNIQRYRMDDKKYRETVNKIFILSSDGRIRTITESHQLG
ncbi:MAG: ATP-binding protein [Flavobacterium sp.]|nr:MAG: ATP-binding protein [Flavobacterium sp.]